MTRDERNRRISELREPSPVLAKIVASDLGYSASGVWLKRLDSASTAQDHVPWEMAMDWHADANWPTLLREMPEPDLWLESSKGEPRYYGCVVDLSDDRRPGGFGDDPADAVCEAWLQWNSRSGSEAR